MLASKSYANVFVYLHSIHYLSRTDVRLIPVLPVQSLSYPLQSLNLLPFNRFLIPYKRPTYSPSTAFLPLQLLPFNRIFIHLQSPNLLPFNYTFIHSQTSDLLPFNPFLTHLQSYLTLTNVRLTPLQMCYLPRTTVRLTHLQTPYLFHTNLCRNRLQLNAYSVRTSRLSLFKPGNASPFNATQRFRLIRIESVTYSHTTVELTPHRKVGLDHLQPNIYPHTKVALIHNSIPHLRAYKGGVYLPSVRCTAKMRYSGHHFSRLTRAGSLHSHPERPAYLMRESRKVAFKLNGEWNGVSPVLHGA